MKSPKPATDNSLNEHFTLWQILSLIFCSIVVAILKMETGRNFAMSGINSGHHNLPTYEMALKLDNVEFVPIVTTWLIPAILQITLYALGV